MQEAALVGPAQPGTPPADPAPAGRTRPRWWGELVVLIGLLWAYDVVRGLAPARVSQAVSTARGLLTFEHAWHVDVEHPLNGALAHAGVLVQDIANYYYATLHIWLTVGVLGWVYWRRPEQYRRLRTVLVLINVMALVVFWLLPLAPPRLLPGAGFVDTIAAGHTIGSWGSPATADANFYAAMPSLHVAWAVWVAIAVRGSLRNRWARRAAAVYPVLTVLVVLATANHYLVDTVAGALTAWIAVPIARRFPGPRRKAADAPPSRTQLPETAR